MYLFTGMILKTTTTTKKATLYKIAQQTGRSQTLSSFCWMQENITQRPGTADPV